jgi:hypothetical protein
MNMEKQVDFPFRQSMCFGLVRGSEQWKMITNKLKKLLKMVYKNSSL